jgi:hypothetical protein
MRPAEPKLPAASLGAARFRGYSFLAVLVFPFNVRKLRAFLGSLPTGMFNNCAVITFAVHDDRLISPGPRPSLV